MPEGYALSSSPQEEVSFAHTFRQTFNLLMWEHCRILSDILYVEIGHGEG